MLHKTPPVCYRGTLVSPIMFASEKKKVYALAFMQVIAYPHPHARPHLYLLPPPPPPSNPQEVSRLWAARGNEGGHGGPSSEKEASVDDSAITIADDLELLSISPGPNTVPADGGGITRKTKPSRGKAKRSEGKAGGEFWLDKENMVVADLT